MGNKVGRVLLTIKQRTNKEEKRILNSDRCCLFLCCVYGFCFCLFFVCVPRLGLAVLFWVLLSCQAVALTFAAAFMFLFVLLLCIFVRLTALLLLGL